MQQYTTLKRKNPDALLFFRCGDFYELFFDDAVEAGRLLGITVTSRSKEADIPMAGVPWHSVDGYVQKLVALGQRVAIAEQLSDPKASKGLVERDVVEVLSPGTVTDQAMLDDRLPLYLLAIAPGRRGTLGLAWADVSAGRLVLHDVDGEEALAEELARVAPAEVLVPDDERGEALLAAHSLPHPRRFASYAFDPQDSERRLQEHLGVATLEAFGTEGLGPALGAAGAVLRYVEENKPDHKASLRSLERFRRDETLVIDPAALRALEVVETVRRRERKGSLLYAVDRTRTAMGARRLREWLLAPLRSLSAVTARHEAVAELVESPARLDGVRDALSGTYDLERLTARIAARRAGPRDLAALREALGRMPALRGALEGASADELERLRGSLEPLPALFERLERELEHAPPAKLSDGGVIREGVSAGLDRVRELKRSSRQLLADMQAREIEATGISSLKIGHNNVFGYYISVTHTHKDKVPAHYIRKQTLKSAERYVTPELKEYEEQVSSAEEKAAALEQELFFELRAACEADSPRLRRLARAAAELDVLAGFAHLARERGYVRPEVDGSTVLHVDEGRHPVIEQVLETEPFVPNDVTLGGEDEPRVAIITGPNMAGKSTYCRQVALIALLAQAGSFVPARAARIGMVDRIFCRLGSADEIMSGLSTFMVEMVETAAILRGATERSLVVLDEVGRGTSTYDGVSLAFSVTEHLSEQVGCRTLFATHYHELCELAETDPRVTNLNVAVREWGNEIVFLHKIEPGTADRSYGLHVARLAGVPKPVVERAEAVLSGLETAARDQRGAPRLAKKPANPTAASRQLTLFAPPASRLHAALKGLDLENLTPLKALNWLQGWQARLRKTDG
jgi:DNA mismatch repair protein MutS